MPAITKLAEAGTELLGVFERMPVGMQEAIGTIAVLGTITALVGGPLSALGGVVLKASSSMGGLRTKMDDGTSSATNFGKAVGGIGAALAVLGASEAIGAIINQLSDVDGITQLATDKLKILASQGQLDTDAATQAIGEQVRSQIGKIDLSNIWGDFGANVSSTTLDFDNSIERVQRAFDSLDSTGAKQQFLDVLQSDTDQMDKSSDGFMTNTEFIKANQDALNIHTQATATDAAAVATLGGGMVDAAGKVDTLSAAFTNLNDVSAEGVSQYTTAASKLSQTVGVIDGLTDANQRLTDAQTRLKDLAKRDAATITNAWDGLAKAKQRLDDILAEDDGALSQVSPEAELAQAKQKLMDANAALALKPGDAGAVTAKDEALADIERAIKRRQDLKKSAKDRARQIRDAEVGVADASKNLSEAQANTGVNSPEYQAALKAERDARWGLAVETLEFVGAVKEGKVNLETIGADLQALADAGLIPQSLVDELIAQIPSLTATVDGITTALESLPGAIDAAQLRLMELGRAQNEPGNRGGLNPTTTGTVPGRPAIVVPPGYNTRGGRFGGSARATGGPVNSGATYQVNESGVELLTMGRQSGYITNAGLSKQRGRNATAAAPGGDNVQINITEAASARRTAEEIVRERRKRAFLGGR